MGRSRRVLGGAALPAAIAAVVGVAGLAVPPDLAAQEATPAAHPFQVGAPRVALGGAGLVEALADQAPSLDRRVLELAVGAARCAIRRGEVRFRTLTVIDYSLPSSEARLWVFDLPAEKLLYHELVSHGSGSGANRSTSFSNAFGTKKSNLGLLTTGDPYVGRNGYSLNLHGLEPGVNDNAYTRRIVIHGAWYVSPEFLAQHGRLGRSWGCPALEAGKSRGIIDRIRGGDPVFIYYPDRAWLAGSPYVKGCGGQGEVASAGSSRIAP